MSRVCQGRQPRLFVAIFRAFTLTFCFVVFVSLFFLPFHYLLLVTLIWQIRSLENAQLYSTLQLIGISCFLAACGVLLSLGGQTMEYVLNIIGMKYRIMSTTAIYNR